MFSVMAEQYVSNLGLPQCYEGMGWRERGMTGEGEGREGGGRGREEKRDYLLSHYLSVEVENSSGQDV